jgi:glucose-1-phosphate adenylyltransferase
MTANLLILAGGASSRMKLSEAVSGLSEEEIHRANTTPKALITFGKEQRPVLDFLLRNAEKAGYKKVYLITGEDQDVFKKYYGSKRTDNLYGSLHISYAVQFIPKERQKPFGTADAVTQTLEQYPQLQTEAFTVCNCDNLYLMEALQAMATTKESNAFVAYDRDGLQFSSERISRFALVVLNEKGHLLDIIEKPSEEAAGSFADANGKFRVSMNLFKLDGASFFPYLKHCPPHPLRNEKELPTAILNFCNDNPNQFKGIFRNEHVPDLTSKEDILVLKDYIRMHYKK